MPKTEHTPGPWHECKNGNCMCGHVWSIPGDFPVCTVADDKQSNLQVVAVAHEHMADTPDLIYATIPREQVIANARLIAAAPDLLTAILNSDDAHWTPAMRAAVAKATNSASD